MESRRLKILFLANSDYGQSNVLLAVVHELIVRGNVDIHVASFHDLEERLSKLKARDLDVASTAASTVTFHNIPGDSMIKRIARSHNGAQIMAHPPGIRGAITAYYQIPELLYPWDAPEYMEGYRACVDIISIVKPDLVVLDQLLSQAIDACVTLSLKYVVLSPNSFRDLVTFQQPIRNLLFVNPPLCSGYPYPIPWYYCLNVIYLFFRMFLAQAISPRLIKLAKYRQQHGANGPLPAFEPYRKSSHYISPAVVESDFPLEIPPNVTGCGPIVLASTPLAETDPELSKWLAQAPTIMVNLGTVNTNDGQFARDFAVGLRLLFEHNSVVQVLWKLKLKGDEDPVLPILKAELDSGRVRIASWLEADPISILESGNVVCSVHHGGANSFHEVVSVGIPQIILATWLDTYQFAACVEWLGIGVYGNKSVAPMVDSNELSKAFMKVLGNGRDDKGDLKMAEKAKLLGKVANKTGGRIAAADKLIEIARSGFCGLNSA